MTSPCARSEKCGRTWTRSDVQSWFTIHKS